MSERPDAGEVAASEWADGAAPGDVNTVPAGKRDVGWAAGEAPPHDWFNWFWQLIFKWVGFFDSISAHVNGAIVQSEQTLDTALAFGDDGQLWEAIARATRHRAAVDAFLQDAFHPAGSGTAGMLGCACVASSIAPGVGSFIPGIKGAAGYAALCGTNTLLISLDQGRTFESAGSVTGTMNDVALFIAAGALGSAKAVTVGDAGVWYRMDYPIAAGAAGTLTTGTISGTPNLESVIWDSENSLWWGVGTGGIYKASDAGALSWTQVSATGHQNPVVITSGANQGRVLFMRPGDSTIYYTDNQSTLTAGATVTGLTNLVHKPVWDAVAGEVLFNRFQTVSKLAATTDGTSSADKIGTLDERLVPAQLGGRVCLVGVGFPNSEHTMYVAIPAGLSPTNSNDWNIRCVGGFPNITTIQDFRVAACDDFAICIFQHASNEVYVTHAMSAGA